MRTAPIRYRELGKTQLFAHSACFPHNRTLHDLRHSMTIEPASLQASLDALRDRWADYRKSGRFESFVEFTLALNSATEKLHHLQLPGLLRHAQTLETAALSLFGDEASHPVSAENLTLFDEGIAQLMQLVASPQPGPTAPPTPERRQRSDTKLPEARPEWPKGKEVWLLAAADHPWVARLPGQLGFYGLRVRVFEEEAPLPEDAAPLAILFLPKLPQYGERKLAHVHQLRTQYPTSHICCLNVPKATQNIVVLLRAGADRTFDSEASSGTLIGHLLELAQNREHEAYRVLIVEDSATATAMVRRALAQHNIDCEAIADPMALLPAVDRYHPDLVLMDMYMPGCTGVEATRVLRQFAETRSLPVVYHSSETDVGMQMEALRLGGDQFLTKPCNPVLLAAVVKTKIERYRDMQRASQHDSLTGLLNHSTIKMRLSQTLRAMQSSADRLCVVMLDIDNFKSVNDTYGHPVGDQVIRSLSWLLRGRLRATDLIGRYGGEEFMVVLRGAELESAYALMDRLRADFATLAHPHAKGELTASFSAGIAAWPEHATDSALTQAADNALLEAKRAGRNRVAR